MKLFLLSCALVAVAVADNIRVEYRLVDYSNPGSVLADGKTKCERSGPCDPKLTGEVDVTSSALNAWPDDKKVAKWVTIFQKKSTDKDRVGKIVSRDICDGNFRKSNLRVQAMDVNTFSSNKEIQQFECLISGGQRDVASSEQRAQWSEPKRCDQKYTKPGNAQLTYQWRVYSIPSRECGRQL
ncbi:uncharacterized protein LOC129587507 [Paramacrobiotus metropolitanus]|uniref:uncharacterized protein LOC129587507 n=1 Tax=Paramacrobiotus metropolitanus TaxID=2943436 RepID=UPI00244658FC|nr:uncharacterized protein LOC129587507 [Paramacrobiotus metropolitanus]